VAVVTERPKILLVDDRPENLLALEAILGSLDVDLVRANSGEEALRALLRAEFALILLDAQMPGMDGFETAARIKRRTRTKDVPIIFLTAVDKDMSSSYRGYVAGGADYISKPFDPWILRAKVQVFVDLWEAGRVQAAQAALLRDREGAGSDLQRAFWERFTGLEEAVHDLGAQLGDAGPAARSALDRVQQRLEELRGTLDGRVSS
jgi:CheY-like chemotaxis protein